MGQSHHICIARKTRRDHACSSSSLPEPCFGLLALLWPTAYLYKHRRDKLPVDYQGSSARCKKHAVDYQCRPRSQGADREGSTCGSQWLR